MARMKQTARKSPGGKAPSVSLQRRASRVTAPGSRGSISAPGEHWVPYVIDKRLYTKDEDDHEPEEYLVPWWKKYGRQLRTWTKRSLHLAGGLHAELRLVDAWVKARRQPTDFFEFLARYSPTVLGASAKNMCMFEALHQAAELHGRPDLVPQEPWDRFVDDAVARSYDVSKGFTWKVLRAYVKRIVEEGSNLSLVNIDRNRHGSGHRCLDGFTRIILENGLYYCAVINVHWTGRCFVLQVQGCIKTVYDGEVKKPLVEYGFWFERIVFVCNRSCLIKLIQHRLWNSSHFISLFNIDNDWVVVNQENLLVYFTEGNPFVAHFV